MQCRKRENKGGNSNRKVTGWQKRIEKSSRRKEKEEGGRRKQTKSAGVSSRRMGFLAIVPDQEEMPPKPAVYHAIKAAAEDEGHVHSASRWHRMRSWGTRLRRGLLRGCHERLSVRGIRFCILDSPIDLTLALFKW